ncbi:NADH-quinone oxidoreductase subunit D [Gossypium arboreum]|uniref:NADH-quinone oxidoreductase subunit D n=1 Tax=Gossypium arboreum TaxID=29729 RepID=A0A0B0M6M8_GOSAR|nr:NADH-quinone oxidoreductase subunit D [Gossypium arboreum]
MLYRRVTRFVSSLVSDKSELHIILSNFGLIRKMALQIADFCPHGRVSYSCMTHGHVARSSVPWCGNEIEVNMLHTPHTQECDLAVLHKSVYPTILPQSDTRACVAISKGTRAKHTGMWLAM